MTDLRFAPEERQRPRLSADSPVRLSCLDRRAMAERIAEWDDLALHAAEPNPFFESWYLLPAIEAMEADEDVSILCLEQDGVLRGLMPIVHQQRYYRWPLPNLASWMHPNCFFGTPLVEQGAEVLFWHTLLDWADANAGMAMFLHLSEVALKGPIHAGLEAVLATGSRPWAVVQSEQRALLQSDLDPASYLTETLTKRKRKDLTRRYNRLNELGEISFEWETGTGNLPGWIEQFLAIEASGWKGEAGSALASDGATTAIFRESLIGAARRNRLLRLALRLDGRPIAMLSTFLTPPGAFGYKTAFDEDYSKYSPGVLLEREFLNALERPEIDWCDSCAAAGHPVMDEMWGQRRAIGRVSIGIGGSLRRAAFRQIIRKEVAKRPED